MWAWVDKVKQFFNTVKETFLGWKEALGWGAKSAEASGQAASRAVDDLITGQNVDAFATAFREELKQEYIRQYLLGIGGLERMTQADWGSIGGMLKEQYHPHLDNFLQDIRDGKLSEAQIRMRAQMYIDSAHEAYERAHARCAEELGMDEELWLLDPPAEHCEDCVAFAQEGWKPKGYFPMPGAGKTQCLTHCRCHKRYRNSKTGKEYD